MPQIKKKEPSGSFFFAVTIRRHILDVRCRISSYKYADERRRPLRAVFALTLGAPVFSLFLRYDRGALSVDFLVARGTPGLLLNVNFVTLPVVDLPVRLL
jgi:hypothetical protein